MITVPHVEQEWKVSIVYNNSAAELNRLRLSLEVEMEIVKHIMEEAKKACAECQEFNCDGCIYRGYRNG